jgi:hypothetical protein
VLSRVQGMEAAYRGLDVLPDVISLRSRRSGKRNLIRSLMSDWRVIMQRNLRRPRPSIDKGSTGSSPQLSLTKLKAAAQ